MTQSAVFTVATLGFQESERVLLRDTLRITEHLAPTFRTLVKDARALPHVVIVNGDHADAVARWENFRRANEGKSSLSTIMWSSKPATPPGKYSLPRPAGFEQLLALLERIVSEEHGYLRATSPSGPQSLLIVSPVEPVAALPPAAQAVTVPTAPQPNIEVEFIPTTVLPRLPQDAAPMPAAETAATVKIAAHVAPEPAAPSAPPPSSSTEIAIVMEAPTIEPLVESPAPLSPIRSRSSKAPQSRFLVVDDSLPVRIQMKEALKGFAKTIDFAHSGEDALFLIDNCKYDVIFLDVIMPGKDGYEVCRYIRSHTMQRQTPVIMLTGNSSPADRVKGKLAGCDTYLIKPVRASVLAEIIGELTKSTAVA